MANVTETAFIAHRVTDTAMVAGTTDIITNMAANLAEIRDCKCDEFCKITKHNKVRERGSYVLKIYSNRQF